MPASVRASARRDSVSGGRTRKQGGMHNILLMNLSRQAVLPGKCVSSEALLPPVIRRPHLGRVF